MNPFYTAEELMTLLNIKKSRAYKLIKDLNAELEAKGFYVVRGRVSADYLMERMGIKNAVQQEEKPKRARRGRPRKASV